MVAAVKIQGIQQFKDVKGQKNYLKTSFGYSRARFQIKFVYFSTHQAFYTLKSQVTPKKAQFVKIT